MDAHIPSDDATECVAGGQAAAALRAGGDDRLHCTF
jgi:hypothetical protein